MNTNLFNQFAQYALSKEEAAQIRGGNDLIKKAVIRLLIDRARQTLDKPYYSHESFENLLDPLEEWKHGHYRSFSCLLDIPLSTIRYFMKESRYFQEDTRQKILAFTTHKTWEDLEKEALIYALKEGLKD
ncbi:MAG: hypothetical protein HC912_02015 [Saprospiraceae bacterium]|nr:hypothetical protein [Saprospiraceae bacterium]